MGNIDAIAASHSDEAHIESVVVRFAGDSGDGVQLTGSQFAQETAIAGNSLATFPDFPAEIRAPAGTTYGVSAFQVHFGARQILTVGDAPDVLVALNPAALKVNIGQLRPSGLVIVDVGAFSDRNLAKAGYDADPRNDGTLSGFRTFEIDVSAQALEVAKPFGLSQKDALRCKNMWVLGLICWMYDRNPDATISFITKKFGEDTPVGQANVAALKAGHAFGETTDLDVPLPHVHVDAVPVAPGEYRLITGAEALSWGLLAGARLADLPMTFCSYPITPSSNLLHTLAKLKRFGVTTFQAEDEIAAVCSAIGASYAGSLGVTASSGPGIALKTEAIGLAIGTELPLVVVNTQRGGPSTGLPTKTEQSDLFLSVWGRNADAPVPVIAAHSPGDCYEAAIEAVRIALKYMTPVMLLSDGYIANAAEPWRIPSISDQTPFPVTFHEEPENFSPYTRDPKTLARPWAKPGTPGLEHRIGGIERDFDTGNISYEPANHQKMTDTRAAKIDGIANDIPPQSVTFGPTKGKLAIVGWGSTFGALNRAARVLGAAGHDVAHIHLRHIWPLPGNLEELLSGFEKVIIAEMNNGQLNTLIKSQYTLDPIPLLKVQGQPFRVAEVEAAIYAAMGDA